MSGSIDAANGRAHGTHEVGSPEQTQPMLRLDAPLDKDRHSGTWDFLKTGEAESLSMTTTTSQIVSYSTRRNALVANGIY
jgi:hypothetical protein